MVKSHNIKFDTLCKIKLVWVAYLPVRHSWVNWIFDCYHFCFPHLRLEIPQSRHHSVPHSFLMHVNVLFEYSNLYIGPMKYYEVIIWYLRHDVKICSIWSEHNTKLLTFFTKAILLGVENNLLVDISTKRNMSFSAAILIKLPISYDYDNYNGYHDQKSDNCC